MAMSMKTAGSSFRRLLKPTTSKWFTHSKPLKYLVGIDGTKYGLSALARAFECSQRGDEIIGLYLPASLERFETELMMFGPTITDPEAKALWGELEKNQKEQIKKVTDACEAVNKERNADAEVTFKMEVGEPSPSPKHDLVHACYDFNADCLVVGSRGLAHSLKETTSKFMHEHVIGSVPDFCADNAPCDVFIVKPKEY